MDNVRKQYDMINVFRVVCAYLVIVVHTVGFQCLGKEGTFITNHWIAMVAIPFFFVTSGYFMCQNYQKEHYLGRYLKKLAIIFVVATILYIPFCLPDIWGDVTSKGVRYLWNTFIITSLPGHLWYISTLMMSAAVVYVFLKRDWIIPLVIIGLILFVIGVIGQCYFNLISSTNPIMRFIDLYNVVFDRIRNGFAFGIPYMTMGVVIYKYDLQDKLKKPALWLAISIILYAIEGYIAYTYETGYESYVFFSHILLIPVMFIMLLNSKLTLSSKTSRTLRDMSLWIYVYHIMVILILMKLRPLWFEFDPAIDNFKRPYDSLLRFGTTAIIITPIAYLICVVMRKLKERRA